MRHAAVSLLASLCVLGSAGAALAHATEGGFVLLLPTDFYIGAGVASVALTVLLIAILPARAVGVLFRPVRLTPIPKLPLRHLTSCLSAVLLGFLVWRGLTGPRDPLANALPLFIWVVWWIALVSLQGLIGNHWRWTNPWTGPAALLHHLTGTRAPFRWPRWLGHWPAVGLFLCFAAFLLADPAPADPTRLAGFVGLYWYLGLLGLTMFGPAWMVRGEAITVLMRTYASIAPFKGAGARLKGGLWGWHALRKRPSGISWAVFCLVLLGTGSFDGLNETFWWMALIGVNPLEFPGRSLVITQNLTGLIVANATLIAAFAACLWLGDRMAGSPRSLRDSFCLYAPTILPIALGYHVAHYLTSLMVDGQYVLKVLNDPMATGANLLGLGDFYVTTGFFNTQATVRVIWLSQAGAVVLGHVVAILMAHARAMRGGESPMRAVLGQFPLALFMIAYTFFGLWLLASPRGV